MYSSSLRDLLGFTRQPDGTAVSSPNHNWRTVAADSDADEACAAALSLRLVYRMQNAFADAVEIAARASEAFDFRGKTVLDIFIFTAASFEDEAHFDFILFPLLKLNDRNSFAQIVAAVFSGEGINGIRS